MEAMEAMKPMKPMEGMKPMEPMDFGPAWWPQELGEPSTSGGQNDVKYAFFGDKHCLAIQKDGQITVYDSGDHRISGVGQQQGGTSSLTFTSQNGQVNIAELRQVS